MTGKERILKTLNGEVSDKTPWVPFTGVHAGALLGFTAKEVSTELDKLIAANLEVNRLYRPDGQPIMFDLQIEAEILGCDLVWAEDSPPSVASHPLAGTDEIPTKIPQPDEGRLKLELDALRSLKESIGASTALYAICCGPFTLASHLRGTEIFMDMILEPEKVERLLEYTGEVAQAVSTYLAEAGADVVAVVDPLISQISADHFAQFMTKPFSELFAHIATKEVKSSFFVCGNATQNIELMCQTGCDSIAVDENVDLVEAKEITDRYKITIGGNLPLTSVMLFGNQQDNMKAVVDLLDQTSDGLLIISPGCDMPYDIPIENTIAAEHAVHETESARAMIANYQREDIEFEGTLPDYQNLERPLIEAFTLDSATCAACTYMVAAAEDAVKAAEYAIDFVEYKYTDLQNIARCKVMGVEQLPSLYINGELAYSSIIPNREELLARVEQVR